MNPTLKRFGYPNSTVKEFEHWVVLIRPVQTTPLSCVIASRAEVTSLGSLCAAAGAELPKVISSFESTVSRLAPAARFNYLALMMVDPNPHFHAIPRYAAPLILHGRSYSDMAYPKPADVLHDLEIDPLVLEQWRAVLAAQWISHYQ
jgi:diadenosine tetraphosphate (Ap4A) HIT family hydrolase